MSELFLGESTVRVPADSWRHHLPLGGFVAPWAQRGEVAVLVAAALADWDDVVNLEGTVRTVAVCALVSVVFEDVFSDLVPVVGGSSSCSSIGPPASGGPSGGAPCRAARSSPAFLRLHRQLGRSGGPRVRLEVGCGCRLCIDHGHVVGRRWLARPMAGHRCRLWS